MKSTLIYKIFESICKGYSNRGELNILEYLLHNMQIIEESENTYRLTSLDNKNDTYKLVINNKGDDKTIDVKPIFPRKNTEYRDFSIKRNFELFECEFIIKKNDNILFNKCFINYKDKSLKLITRGYDKYSLEIIESYLNDCNDNASIISVMDKLSSEIWIDDATSKLMIKPDLKTTIRICNDKASVEQEICDYPFESFNQLWQFPITNYFNLAMGYLDKMNLFEKLENNEFYRIPGDIFKK